MAGGLRDTRTFFTKGSAAEWEYILSIYKEALKLKAQQKNKKPEELLKLDCWYQEELPKLIQSRKEKHVTHSELVQTMKWKLLRGKYRPRLTDLVRINTPAAVMLVSKKAFRKLPNLASAIQTLSSLKGIGPATASAILAAGAPELAPYMADECLMAIPECQAIDYTVQEYLIFTEQIQVAVERLNAADKNRSWTPHKVEKALWTYCIVNEFDPSLLANMPTPADEDADALPNSQNGKSDSQDTITNSEDQHEVNDEEENATEKRDNGQKAEAEAAASDTDDTSNPAKDQHCDSTVSSSDATAEPSRNQTIDDEVEEEPASKKQKTE